MNALQESRGLVIIDADDYGIPDELILSIITLSLPLLNKEHLTYPYLIGPKPFDSYLKVGSDIARILGIEGIVEDGYLIEYYEGESLRAHRDYSMDGGYKVGLRLAGSGSWSVGDEQILAEPGKLMIQDMGKAVEHAVPVVTEYTLTAVWDFNL